MKLINKLKDIKLCHRWEDINIKSIIVKDIDLLEKYEDVFIFKKYISENSPVAIFKEGKLENLPIIYNNKINNDFAIEYTTKKIEPYCNTCGNNDFPDNFNYENHYANGYVKIVENEFGFLKMNMRNFLYDKYLKR